MSNPVLNIEERRPLTNNCWLKPGDMLNNKYKVVKRLGTGRFSTVWSVQSLDGNNYAAKVYKAGSKNLDYFNNELKICKFLPDENCYTVKYVDSFAILDYDETTFTSSLHPCVIFSLLGDSLHRLLNYIYEQEGSGGLPIPTVKSIIKEILTGLKFLHDNDIVHTDIKPENVLMTKCINEINSNEEISVMITDMGSSTFVDNLFTHTVGTHEYISPEVIFRLDYDTKIDIWALGCLCFELLTGDELFESYREDDSDDESAEGGSETEDTASSFTDTSSLWDTDSSTDGFSGGSEWHIDYQHLILMENLLGPMPISMAKKGREFYNSKGRLKHNPLISSKTIAEVLAEYDFTPEECSEIQDFMQRCLKYLPKERATAEQLLAHPWLADA